jgi:two-component system probable response regulator PhcQ
MLNPDSNSRCALLYVDDEVKALKYFQMAFEEKFPIFTASSATEGLEILRREKGRIGIVVSDQRMPEMQGAEFLGLVREEYPYVVRILTTAYTDLKDAIAAVNTGHIYQYVTKPWEIPDFGMVLQRAWDYYRVLTERNELLALKLTALQRILCSDRLKWLLLWSRSLAEPERSAARRALCALVDAMPEELNPLSASGAAAGPRQFDIGDLLRSEYGNASACLDALEAMRGSGLSDGDALGALVARLDGEGFASGEIAVEVGPDSAFTLALRPTNPAFDAAAFVRRLFGLLIEKDTAPLSIALFASLLAVARTNGSLSISLHLPETSRDAKIFSFRTQEASPEPTGVIEALCEKFSASDISRL